MSWRQPTYIFKLIIDGSTYEIDEPEGFDEIVSHIYRDETAHGMFFEMTPAEVPLKFTGTAKTLLRNAFDADGVDSQSAVQFKLEKIPNKYYHNYK